MFASAQYNHWEDDDYNRYLSDLFWDNMLDMAPWMRVRREACPSSWAAEPARCRRTHVLSERGAGAAGLGTRVVPDERALRAARGAQRGGAVGGLGRRWWRDSLRSGTV